MPEDPHPPVTYAELYAEIARRDQRITELTATLAELLNTYDRGIWRGKTNWDTAWANARIALGLTDRHPGWTQPSPGGLGRPGSW